MGCGRSSRIDVNWRRLSPCFRFKKETHRCTSAGLVHDTCAHYLLRDMVRDIVLVLLRRLCLSSSLARESGMFSKFSM